MARVTVEDCLLVEPNRFKLILAASERVKQLEIGDAALVDHNNKYCVVALREIGERCVDPAQLLQKRYEPANRHYSSENINDIANVSEELDLNVETTSSVSEASTDVDLSELENNSEIDQDTESEDL